MLHSVAAKLADILFEGRIHDDEYWIQKISGHANVSTTMGIYAHTRSDLVNEAGEKFVGLLAESKGGIPQKQAVPG